MTLNNNTQIFKGSTPWNGKIFRGETLIWPVDTVDYSGYYFTLEVVDTGNTGEFFLTSTRSDILNGVEFSVNEGEWKHYSGSTSADKTVSFGDTVRVRYTTDSLSSVLYPTKMGISGAKHKVYGNIMSLLYGDNFVGKTSFQPGSDYNFYRLFDNNTNLVDAKNLILPATVLVENCYDSMFIGCTSLVSAPALPAMTLAKRCYGNMFGACFSLIKAPVLLAATLVDSCYAEMFYNCPSLIYVKCMATDISARACTSSWLTYQYHQHGISGTFVKHPSMNDWTIGSSGIPEGWTVVNG